MRLHNNGPLVLRLSRTAENLQQLYIYEDGYRKCAGKGIPAAARGSHVFRHLRKRKP